MFPRTKGQTKLSLPQAAALSLRRCEPWHRSTAALCCLAAPGGRRPAPRGSSQSLPGSPAPPETTGWLPGGPRSTSQQAGAGDAGARPRALCLQGLQGQPHTEPGGQSAPGLEAQCPLPPGCWRAKGHSWHHHTEMEERFRTMNIQKPFQHCCALSCSNQKGKAEKGACEEAALCLLLSSIQTVLQPCSLGNAP